jgi:hypothetical protein
LELTSATIAPKVKPPDPIRTAPPFRNFIKEKIVGLEE